MRTIFAECGKSRWFLPSLFALCMILWFLRKPDSILAAQPFAEDATVNLEDAIQSSWSSLFFSHGDYLNVINQIIANFSLDLFGLANAPLAMQLTGMSIDILCAVFFATNQFRFIIKSDLLRACCSFFIILVPGVVQMFEYNVTVIEYFLNIFLLLFTTLLLFNYDEFAKKSLKIKYLYGFFCSITFLTSAYSVVFLPVFVYVTIRQIVKDKKELATIFSYALPVIAALVQVSTLYISHLQNYNYFQTNHLTGGNIGAFLLLFSGGIAKVFYPSADSLFQQTNWPVYLISIAVVAFVLLNSIKTGLKVEVYVLVCIVAFSFSTAIIRGAQYLAGSPLSEGGFERYFFDTIVFSFILLVRQFDKRRTTVFRVGFVIMMAVIVFNVSSGFSIPPYPDMNYEKFAKLYTPEGKYSCGISVVPYYYFFEVPCLEPTSVNQTITTLAFPQHAIAGNVTFTVTVSPSPNGGSILIYIDGKQAKIININGGQTTLRMPLAPGSHKIFASYSESPNFSASNSSLAAVTVYSTSNLKGAELSDANLYGMNLSYSDLSGADLFGARLADANLAGANLEKANLTLAFMPGVDLRRGNLHESNLQNTNLQDSDLADADLSGDNLVGAVLAGADLSGANLSGANLSGANLRGANIAGANFTGAITDNCNGCPQMK